MRSRSSSGKPYRTPGPTTGFESLTVHQNQEDPAAFLIWELWNTRQNYETYLAWRTETGALADLVAMLASPPSFRFFGFVGV